MKIILPVAQRKSLEFASLKDLAEHYNTLAAAFMNESLRAKTKKEARFAEGKYNAYSSIAWQISRLMVEPNYHNCDDCGIKIPLLEGLAAQA